MEENAELKRQLRRSREALEEKNQRLKSLRTQLRKKEALARLEADPFPPDRVVWVFGTGRSGSTWLASMLSDLLVSTWWDEPRVGAKPWWDEPLVGALFGGFYALTGGDKRGKNFIFGRPYRDLWIGQIRRMVLEGAAARYDRPPENGYLVIKEPHGSIGAPLLSAALPESRLIFLVRDPRDVIASALDAQKEGSWTANSPKRRGETRPPTQADTAPNIFARRRAKVYLDDISKAREAHDAHEGPKSLVRYEDLRAAPLGEMRRILSDIRVSVSEPDLTDVVEKRSWEALPEANRGSGKFYRKGTPGAWREDLTAAQVRIVEEVTAALLEEYYPGSY